MSEDKGWLAMPAAVARFLHDPLAVQGRGPAGHPAADATQPAELMGTHLPDALAAQAHALSGRHHEARNAMQRALKSLETAAADSSLTATDRLHMRSLTSLALGFIAREALLADPAGQGGEAQMAEALRRRPDLSYLWRLQAERLAQLGRIDDAIETLDRADALGSPKQTLFHATLVARWTLEEEPAKLDRLQRVERRFFGGSRPHESEDGEKGLAEFWHGRLLLAMSEAADGIDEAKAGARSEAVLRWARSALEQLRRAELLLSGEAAEAAAHWSERARQRLPVDEPLERAMLASRLERADATAAARLVVPGERPNWRGLAQVIAQFPTVSSDGPGAIDLLVPVLRDLHRTEPRRLPVPQRIKLAIPASLAPDDAAMMTVIGDGPRKPVPSIARLREEVLRRFGVEMPGVQLRGDSLAISMSLDGVRLATHLVPPGPQRLRLRRRDRTAADTGRPPSLGRLESGLDWFGLEAWLEPETDAAGVGLPAGLLASVFASVHVVRYLDRFIGTRDLARLELQTARPGPVLTMLRVLAADRTPLVATALRDLCRLVDSRELTPLQGVNDYRALPEIRGRLWGARDRRLVECDFDKAPEDLATRLRAVIPAADVPDRICGLSPALVDEILAWAGEHLPERSCVLVRDPELRPWLRALIRPRWPDVPVLTTAERSTSLRLGIAADFTGEMGVS